MDIKSIDNINLQIALEQQKTQAEVVREMKAKGTSKEQVQAAIKELNKTKDIVNELVIYFICFLHFQTK